MPCVLKEVCIENFKSLRNLKVSLKKFNVLVGPNGSGKTNFIEFFKFLKNALTGMQRPYIPYLDWWDYRNIVWQRREDLPITAKLGCVIDELDLEYEVSFGVAGGIFRILSERIAIDKILVLEREGPILKISHDHDFLKENADAISQQLENLAELVRLLSTPATRDVAVKVSKEITVESLSKQLCKLPEDVPNLLWLMPLTVPYVVSRKRGTMETQIFGDLDKVVSREDIGIIVLPSAIEKQAQRSPLRQILRELNFAIANFTILKHPNMDAIKSASLPLARDFLIENSSNLVNVLHKWFSEKGKLPERIGNIISELFPNTQIGFELTFDGKIFLKIYEKGVELHPPSIPDGLYKVLAILAAIELNPSLLAIDEIENSLYKEALEYVLDELRDCNSTVIITTHSPLVVDIVRLEDLLVVEKTGEGTVASRIEEPEELRRKLTKLKVTQSESWLYGELKK